MNKCPVYHTGIIRKGNGVLGHMKNSFQKKDQRKNSDTKKNSLLYSLRENHNQRSLQTKAEGKLSLDNWPKRDINDMTLTIKAANKSLIGGTVEPR